MIIYETNIFYKKEHFNNFQNLSEVEAVALDKGENISYNSRPKTDERHQIYLIEDG